MKRSLLTLIFILLFFPSNIFALNNLPYDASNLLQSDEFRLDLIQDTTSRKENINLNLKNFSDSQAQSIFDHITNIIFYQSNMDIYSITMDGSVNGRTANLILNLDYRMTKDENAKVDEWIKSKLDSFLALSPTDLEVIKFVNDTIVKHVEYDTSYQKNSAYHAVFNKETLCEGYAFLTYKMLSYAGIDAKIISGVAASEDHMWNLVKYEDIWYHLDVTWNDPVYNTTFKKPLDFVSYDFFMLTDNQISKTHTWDKAFFPALNPIN